MDAGQVDSWLDRVSGFRCPQNARRFKGTPDLLYLGLHAIILGFTCRSKAQMLKCILASTDIDVVTSMFLDAHLFIDAFVSTRLSGKDPGGL